MTRVGTVKRDLNRPDAVRIDRRTKWGNPFPITSTYTRADVIELYRAHLWSQIRAGSVTVDDLLELDGKVLCCHCHPKPCHGDVLARAVEWATRRRD